MTEKTYRSNHDRTFALLMGNKPFVKSLCKFALPKAVFKPIDWRTLKPADSRLVDSLTKRQDFLDIIFEVALLDGTIALIHFEHQSTTNRFIPIRFEQYRLSILKRYMRLYTERIPPLIFTIPVHQGIKPNQHGFEIKNLYKDAKVQALYNEYAQYPYPIDMGAISDDQFREQTKEFSPAWLLMKYVRSKKINDYCTEVLTGLNQLDSDLRDILLEYLVQEADIPRKSLLEQIQHYLPNQEEFIMSVAQQFKQEGIQQGMQQGISQERVAIAANMLRAGEPMSKVAQFTMLNEKTLKKLQDK